MTFLLAFAIGIVAGLRSLTAPAVVAWAARLGWLHLQGSPLAFMSSAVTVAVASVCAVVELVWDKLPTTPSRSAPLGLTARVVMGALAGAAVAQASGRALALGAGLGVVGGIAGAFAGAGARRRAVAALRVRDLGVALVEDALAIGVGLYIVSRS